MVAATALGFTATSAFAQGEQQVLVNQAETTLSNFMRDPEMKWLQQNIGRAKAVLISPEIVKAGFIIGGSGGRALAGRQGRRQVGRPGVLHAGDREHRLPGRRRRESEMVTLVMTDKGMNSLLASSLQDRR